MAKLNKYDNNTVETADGRTIAKAKACSRLINHTVPADEEKGTKEMKVMVASDRVYAKDKSGALLNMNKENLTKKEKKALKKAKRESRTI